MDGLLPSPGDRRWLVVIAAPAEWRAVAPGLARHAETSVPSEWSVAELSDRFDAVLSGVGKANAAGATARVLDPGRHAGVISIGVAGALPESGLAIGDLVAATRSVMADEGVRTDGDFIDLVALNFPPTPEGSGIEGSPELLGALSRPGVSTGIIATVSSCSGSDAEAERIRSRTGAVAEAMEGAAVGASTRRVLGPGAPFIEVRAISNTTGDRATQRWDLAAALAALSELARAR